MDSSVSSPPRVRTGARRRLSLRCGIRETVLCTDMGTKWGQIGSRAGRRRVLSVPDGDNYLHICTSQLRPLSGHMNNSLTARHASMSAQSVGVFDLGNGHLGDSRRRWISRLDVTALVTVAGPMATSKDEAIAVVEGGDWPDVDGAAHAPRRRPVGAPVCSTCATRRSPPPPVPKAPGSPPGRLERRGPSEAQHQTNASECLPPRTTVSLR
jgi:hypothetical protein